MKKTSLLLGIGLAVVLINLTLPAVAGAQQAQPGDTFIAIFPEGTFEGQPNFIVTGQPKPAKSVGSCWPGAGQFSAQDVNVVQPSRFAGGGGPGGGAAGIPGGEDKPVGTTEMIIVGYSYRNENPAPLKGIALPMGTRLGSPRGGGLCGPGWQSYMIFIYQEKAARPEAAAALLR